MIFYRKSVCFVLNSRNKFKSFTVRINRYLNIIVIKSSRIMVVVFNHSTYRNFKSKLVKYLKCNIYLTTAAIHHNKVWIYIKSRRTFYRTFKPPCKHFSHALVIVRSFYSLYLKFSIVIFLWLSILKYNH